MKRYAFPSGAAFDQFTRETREEALRDEKRAALYTWHLLSKRWTLLILTELLVQPQSFQGLFNQIEGISEKVLSQRLKDLQGEGVLRRENTRGRHVRAEYHLTEKGKALEPVIRAISLWSQCL